MDFLWDKITEWLKEMLIGGIVSNLSGMFDATNQKVAEISGQVGLSPQAWNGSIFSMIQNLSETVIVPIAGAILAFVMTLELIQLITDKNNLNDMDTWIFFKWAFKSAAAVLIVTNTWTIVMGGVRCRPKRRCQRLWADYRRHQHQHFKRHGGYRGSADGNGAGAAVRPVVPIAVRGHYHVGADHLHFHYHIRKND